MSNTESIALMSATLARRLSSVPTAALIGPTSIVRLSKVIIDAYDATGATGTLYMGVLEEVIRLIASREGWSATEVIEAVKRGAAPPAPIAVAPIDDRTVVERIKKAFEILRSVNNIAARMRYLCCGSCGHSGMHAKYKKARGYVFYHAQSADALNSDGELKKNHKLCLYYGGEPAATTEEAREASQLWTAQMVVKALAEQGLKTEWDGTTTQAVQIVGVQS